MFNMPICYAKRLAIIKMKSIDESAPLGKVAAR